MKFLNLIFILSMISWCYADTIYFKSGTSRTEVSIVSETHKQVVYMTSNKQISAKTESIEWIEYSDCPQDLILGRSAINQGKYEEAVDFIQNAIEESGLLSTSNSWFKVYSNYFLARANQNWANTDSLKFGRYQGAIELYKKVIKFKNNRYLYECYSGLAQCYINVKKYNKAKQYLTKMQSEASSGSVKSAYWEIHSLLLQGDNFLAQKSYSAAISRYERAESKAGNEELEDLQREATAKIGDCYIENKKFSEAKRHFEKMKNRADKNDYNSLAAAENGIAATLLGEGNVRAARRKVIQVILKYYDAEKERPRALFISGQCYEKAKEKGNFERARACYQFLVNGYPGNPWTVKALRQLQEISEKEESEN